MANKRRRVEPILEMSPKHLALFGACWPIFIELWLAFVLVSFFIIRVLGSNLGQRIIFRHHG
jgi:hypothetical protein